jgi:quinolinate synthase
MVSRLAREVAPGKEVVSLDDCFCVCSTMARIDPPHLLWALEGLASSDVRNAVRVPEAVASDARVALDRMLRIT